MMPYFVYLVECRDKTLYCGYTNGLMKRIDAHNKGKGAKYTQRRMPVKLVYYEKFDSKSDAMKREHRIKTMPRDKKLALIAKKKHI